MRKIKLFSCLLILVLMSGFGHAQQRLFDFGQEVAFGDALAGVQGEAINWINVNTTDTTWYKDGDKLIGKGWPIGVVRSEKMYQNFILEVEWRHMEQGGNSGIFVWCDAQPEAHNRLPSGVEVQMLELDWVNQNQVDGKPAPIAYVHGELFGAGKTKTLPDNARGTRSKSIENRCLAAGEWNRYTVVCVDGTIKLSVNGKFVNGIRESSQRKGYLCLEAEGARIEFRKLKVISLDEGYILPEHIVDAL